MNSPQRVGLRRVLTALGILVCSGMLLAFAFLPTLPVHSQKAGAAYSQYLRAPTPETKRAYEDVVDSVNRPFHLLQYISGICGLALPFVLFRRLTRPSS
jgi:hypothetical protein